MSVTDTLATAENVPVVSAAVLTADTHDSTVKSLFGGLAGDKCVFKNDGPNLGCFR